MTTECTAMISSGATFSEFVLSCARQFMPGSQPVPERFEVDPFHANSLVENRAKLVELETMSVEDRVTGCAAYNAQVEEHRVTGLRRMNELREQYIAMRAHVKAWHVPSDKHLGLRNSMLEQIDEDLERHCGYTHYDTPAKPLLPIEWLEQQKITVLNNIEYHNKKSREITQLTADRNEWIAQLRASLTNEEA